MTSSKLQYFGVSGATFAEPWDKITYPASGATMVAPEAEPAYERRALTTRRRFSLQSIIIATMLPLRAIDELAFQRRHDSEVVNSFVFYVEGEEPDLLESPSIVAVWPKRQTFLFRSGRPVRRLPPRLPFIPPGTIVEEE
jgi:hypothetical protein